MSRSNRLVFGEQFLSPLDKVLDALPGRVAGCPKLKVLWPVIVPGAVGMVHALILSQKTTERGFDDHPMLCYQTSHRCGMLGHAQLDIPPGVNEAITARRAQVDTGIAVTLDAIPVRSTPAGRIGRLAAPGMGATRAVLPATIPIDVMLAAEAASHSFARAVRLATCFHHRDIVAHVPAVCK